MFNSRSTNDAYRYSQVAMPTDVECDTFECEINKTGNVIVTAYSDSLHYPVYDADEIA